MFLIGSTSSIGVLQRRLHTGHQLMAAVSGMSLREPNEDPYLNLTRRKQTQNPPAFYFHQGEYGCTPPFEGNSHKVRELKPCRSG